MALEVYIVERVSRNTTSYRVHRYKSMELCETTEVELTKLAPSQYERKRMIVAEQWAKFGHEKGKAYFFNEKGIIQEVRIP